MAAAHTYPSNYAPGSKAPPALNKAWEILDSLTPGALSDQVRAFLAGLITAELMKLHEQRDAMCRTLSAFAEGAIQNEGVCLASPSYGDTDTVEIPYCIGDLREAVRLTAYTSKNDTWIKYAGPAKEPA